MDFEKAIVAAIVTQYFQGYEVRTEFGTQRHDAPVAKLAGEMIKANESQIVKAIMKKLDITLLAQQIADELHKNFISSFYIDKTEKESVKKLVFEKYAEIKAKQMINQEKNND